MIFILFQTFSDQDSSISGMKEKQSKQEELVAALEQEMSEIKTNASLKQNQREQEVRLNKEVRSCKKLIKLQAMFLKSMFIYFGYFCVNLFKQSLSKQMVLYIHSLDLIAGNLMENYYDRIGRRL